MAGAWAGGLAQTQRASAPLFPRGMHLPGPPCSPKHPWVHPRHRTELPSWTPKVGRARHRPPETPGTSSIRSCATLPGTSQAVQHPGLRTPRVITCFVTGKRSPNTQLSPQPQMGPHKLDSDLGPVLLWGRCALQRRLSPPKTEGNSQPGPKSSHVPSDPILGCRVAFHGRWGSLADGNAALQPPAEQASPNRTTGIPVSPGFGVCVRARSLHTGSPPALKRVGISWENWFVCVCFSSRPWRGPGTTPPRLVFICCCGFAWGDFPPPPYQSKSQEDVYSPWKHFWWRFSFPFIFLQVSGCPSCQAAFSPEGTVLRSQCPSFRSLSRISQLNIPGFSRLYSSIFFSTSGVATCFCDQGTPVRARVCREREGERKKRF